MANLLPNESDVYFLKFHTTKLLFVFTNL